MNALSEPPTRVLQVIAGLDPVAGEPPASIVATALALRNPGILNRLTYAEVPGSERAMACGTLVVASTAPSFAEIVGDAGLLEDPHDTAALTRAVRAVFESSDLSAHLRAKGFARAQALSWDRAIDSYRQVYGRLLADAPCASTTASACPSASAP